MKILYILIEALVITVYTPVKTHLAVQWVHFVEYKSYLNIFDFLKTREKKRDVSIREKEGEKEERNKEREARKEGEKDRDRED